MCRLLQLASHFRQPVCFLIAPNTTVRRDPLEGHRCLVLKLSSYDMFFMLESKIKSVIIRAKIE